MSGGLSVRRIDRMVNVLVEGRHVDAEKAYEALRQLAPGTGEIHARLGLIYFQQGRFDEALPSLAKAFSEPGDPVVRRMAGLHLLRVYTGLERDRDAVDVALRLSQRYPDDPEVLYHASRLFASFADLQTTHLAKVAPESVWLHQAAGEANESQGQYDAALSDYRKVIEVAPRRRGIHFRIGRVLLARAKDDPSNDDAIEARRAFEAELKLDPTNASAAYELAELERKAGELERARELFSRAVAHHPRFETALVGLARTLLALDRPKEALLRRGSSSGAGRTGPPACHAPGARGRRDVAMTRRELLVHGSMTGAGAAAPFHIIRPQGSDRLPASVFSCVTSSRALRGSGPAPGVPKTNAISPPCGGSHPFPHRTRDVGEPGSSPS